MREALNGFVIRGIAATSRSRRRCWRTRSSSAGDFNTGFIAEHYAQGFRAEDVPHDDPDFLVALAAYVQPPHRAARGRHQRPAARATVCRSARSSWWSALTARRAGTHTRRSRCRDLRGQTGSSRSVASRATQLSKSVATAPLGELRAAGARATAEPFIAQVERGAGKQPAGAAHRAQRRAAGRAGADAAGAELHALMPYKAPPDLSRFLLSPMPGLLVDCRCSPARQVQAGEKLAVIEAMKMENVLFAAAGRRGRAMMRRAGRVAGGGPGHPAVRNRWRHERPRRRATAGRTGQRARFRAGRAADRHRRPRQGARCAALGRLARSAS